MSIVGKFVLRSISYFRADIVLIGMLFVLIGTSVALNLLQAWPMAILVDTVLSKTPQERNGIHELFLNPFGEEKVNQILGITAIWMATKMLQETVWMFRMMLNSKIKFNGTRRVRKALYEKLQELSLSWHHARPQGDVIYRMSFDSLGPWGILDTLIGSSAASVTLSAMMVIMFSRSASLTLLALSIVPFLIVVNHYFSKKIRTQAAEAKRRDADLTTTAQRAITAIRLIQAFGRQGPEAQRFSLVVDKTVQASMSLAWQENLYPLAVQIIFACGGAIIFGYGGYLVYRDQFLFPVSNGVTCGDLIVFMAYLNQLWDPLGWVLGFPTKIQTFAASCDRIFKVLDENPEITDVPEPIELPLQPRTLMLSQVSFGYEGRVVLQDVTAIIEPGEMVAFLGSSGAGKSTLLSLLSRFYDPFGGALLLDGVDLRHIRLSDVRKHIALVSQDSPLFPGTILENIQYGREDAALEEVALAAQEAGAAEFIEALPKGYETEIIEGGQNFSGGQKQRIAIARALVSEAPFLVLDEPTSALDAEHERIILETLERLRRKKTIILVTHRLDTVKECDRIYVLHRGFIVERGTHDELIEQGGVYAQMHLSGQPLDAPQREHREVSGL